MNAKFKIFFTYSVKNSKFLCKILVIRFFVWLNFRKINSCMDFSEQGFTVLLWNLMTLTVSSLCTMCKCDFSADLSETGGEITFGGTNPEHYIEQLIYHPIYEYNGM